jgi:hypothetical protein
MKRTHKILDTKMPINTPNKNLVNPLPCSRKLKVKLATKNSNVYAIVAIYILLASTLYLDCAKSDLTALNPYKSIRIVINKNTIGKKSLVTIFYL